MRKSISIAVSLAFCGMLAAHSAAAQDTVKADAKTEPETGDGASASLTREQQAALIREVTGFYRGLSAIEREFALPLIASLANEQLPYRDAERGVQLNSVKALPQQRLAVKMGFLPDGPMANLDAEVAQTLLAPIARKLACSDATLRPILDLGIRIQLDIADARAQHLTDVDMDSGACVPGKSVEESLEELGVE